MRRNYSDSIFQIIKTIKPVHYAFAYSKQNKDYNKHFLSLDLNVINFFKNLDKINKTNTNFHQNDFKKIKNYKYIVDGEIHKNLNLLEKKIYAKYLPRTILNKMNIINNDEEEEHLENGKKTKNVENKIKKLKFISKLDERYYNGITLDPGRYDPKYNLIYKRTKDVFIGRPKTSYINHNNNEINYENTKEKKNLHNLKTKLIEDIKDNKTVYNKRYINNTNYKKNNNIIKSSSQYNFKTSRFSRSSMNRFNIVFNKNTYKNNNIHSRALTPKINSISLKKNPKKNNYNKYRNNKIFSSAKKKNINLDLENKNEEEKNKEMERNKSSKGILTKMFSFDKMMGRRKDLFIIRENTKNVYTPKYDIIRPYMYVKQFVNKINLKGYKKYAVGKIIRNYGFSPKEYFIFDINSKRQNEINDDFLNFINEKYKL